ncbi:MAG: MMPL family transporter [Thiotrichaceae bacterium]|nr:MMPL family transporter [Thiotrichaceae bacterium]
MIERYAHWLIKWRYFVIIAILILLALTTLGFPLKVDTDYRVFFSEDNPQLLAFDELENTYTKNDNVLLVLAPKDGEVFTNETLDAVEWLTRESWQIPYSNRVDSITNFQYSYAEGDNIIVEDLIREAKTLSDEEITRAKEITLAEPQLINMLISPQAHVTGINVTVQLTGEHPETEMPDIVTFVRDLADQVRKDYPQIEVHITGTVMLNYAGQEAINQDMQTLLPIMYMMIFILLWVLLKSFSAVFVTVLIISFSTLSAMGLAGLLGIVITGPANAASIIILTLAIADSVHLLATLRYEMQTSGRNKHEAIIESLRINFQAIFLTSLTTAIGFITLNFSEVPPYRDLGNIVAMGVIAAFILSITLLPALMAILPVRHKAQTANTIHFMDQLGDFVVAKRQALMWSVTILVVVLVAFLPQNELNDNFVKQYDKSVEFRQATDFITTNLTGLYDIHYSLGANESINEPKFLQSVDQFAQWLRQQPEVKHVNTITDIFKRLNRTMHGDDPDYYYLPAQRELAAQYLLLYEMSLPYGLDINNQVNVDKSATHLTATLSTLSTNEILAFEERVQDWLKENAQASMQVPGTSVMIMFANISYRNIPSMLFAAIVALILISFVLIIAFRSVKFGLISLIPNLVPAAMAFGLWGMFVGQLGLALSLVTALTIGIVVDDTIHYLSKYLQARREQNLSPELAVRYAFRSVGLALWITSTILVAGFLVLYFSIFTATAQMGIMISIIVICALITDFFLLPPLLMKLEETKS